MLMVNLGKYLWGSAMRWCAWPPHIWNTKSISKKYERSEATHMKQNHGQKVWELTKENQSLKRKIKRLQDQLKEKSDGKKK